MEHTPEYKPSRAKEIIFGSIALILFLILYFWMLNVFKKEGEERTAVLTVNHQGVGNYLFMDFRIVSIDPVRGDIDARIEFDPVGTLATDEDFLNEDLDFYVNNSAGAQEYRFPKGSLISPIHLTLALYNGMVSDYPYDSYDCELWIELSTPIKNDTTGNVEDVPIDRELHFSGSIHGFNIHAARDEQQPSQVTAIKIDVSRTRSVVFFSVYVMILMWLLAIGVLFVVLSVVVRKRKVELGLLGFNSAMLFALPALRNMQPFSPPIGCLSDYMAFFWAEGIFGMTLVLLIIIWLKRPGVKI